MHRAQLQGRAKQNTDVGQLNGKAPARASWRKGVRLQGATQADRDEVRQDGRTEAETEPAEAKPLRCQTKLRTSESYLLTEGFGFTCSPNLHRPCGCRQRTTLQSLGRLLTFRPRYDVGKLRRAQALRTGMRKRGLNAGAPGPREIRVCRGRDCIILEGLVISENAADHVMGGRGGEWKMVYTHIRL